MKQETTAADVAQETTPTQEEVTNQEATAVEAEDTDATAQPTQTVEQLQEELAATHDKYLRLYSEFENFRRRASKEKLSLIERAGKDIFSNLLPIVDDFERAIKALHPTDEAAATLASEEGIHLIYGKLRHLLEQAGVQVMPVEKGADFDTELHEAVTQMAVEDKEMKGKVLEVVEKGYLLKEKVLRFAKVVTGA